MHSQITADTPTLTHKQAQIVRAPQQTQTHMQIVNLPLTCTELFSTDTAVHQDHKDVYMSQKH